MISNMVLDDESAVNNSSEDALETLTEEVALRAHGFSVADFAKLCREACLRNAVRAGRARNVDLCTDAGPNLLKLSVESASDWHSDFDAALSVVAPSTLAADRVGGSTDESALGNGTIGTDVMQQLQAAIALPLSDHGAAIFERAGLRPPCGMVLYGPAGNGKTSLARSIAHAADANFIEVSAAQLLSPVSGESEKNVASLFARARRASPTILFIDELENLTPCRSENSTMPTLDRVLAVFLTQLDGISSRISAANVVLIAATRDIFSLDPAIIRSGRVETHIYVGPPTESQRAAIIRQRCSNMGTTSEASIDVGKLVARSAGWSRAEVDNMCREAAMRALRENIHARHVRMDHFASKRS